MGVCYDIEGNTVDCSSTFASGYSPGVSASDAGAGLNLTSNPIATQAATSNGTTGHWYDSVLNFGSVALKTFATPQASPTSLRLQVNPATGQTQYYNPATNTYLPGPVSSSGSIFGSGSNSFLLVIVAVIVGFFAFGGRKMFAKA